MVPSSGPIPSPLMIVGEFPGDEEVYRLQPFVGPPGRELDKMLIEGGLSRHLAFLTHALKFQPPSGDITRWIPKIKKDITRSHVEVQGRMVLPLVREGIETLEREIREVRPRVILALGTTALWALTGKWGIKHFRGSILKHPSGAVVIPTWPPDSVLRQWELRSTTVQDIRRASRALRGEGLEAPKIVSTIRPSYQDTIRILQSYLTRLAEGPLPLSLDIETRANQILCIALAPSPLEALCIPFVETQKHSAHYWLEAEEAEIVWLLTQIFKHPNLIPIWQNGLFDAQYIHRAWHVKIQNQPGREGGDTMLAWHTCFPGMQKSLDFLASMLCDHYVQWKGISRELNKIGGKEDD